jgi:hypothetical protein
VPSGAVSYEIIQATDEDVERFIIQVGNDTDPVRRSWYKRKKCLISFQCRLSPNSLRLLYCMFMGREGCLSAALSLKLKSELGS